MLPESVHWFRIADNNPVVVDGTVIDSLSYSRSVSNNLPQGHSWSANANRKVAESLGYQDTQAVMYSLLAEDEVRTSLNADDVAMVKMGMTGQDQLAGSGDDYTIEITLVDSCAESFDVKVTFDETPEGVAANCQAGVDFSFPQNPLLARHYTLVPPPGEPFVIKLSEDINWDVGPGPIFSDGFEGGNLDARDDVVP